MTDRQGKTPGKLFAEAVHLHNLGVDGDQEAVRKAHEMFKEIWTESPENCLAEAYLGSATALLGRDHPDLNEKFKLAIEGLKLLDSAVSKEPATTEIRILRGHVCYNLPDMYFHRLTTAVEDFSYLISRYRRNRRSFSRDFLAQTLFDLGSAYKQLGRTGEAETTWKRILSVTRDPKYLELLKQEGFPIPEWMIASQRMLSSQRMFPSQRMLSSQSHSGTDLSAESLQQLTQAKQLHRRALAGDKDAALQAFAYFAKATKERPQDHLIKAYYADCLSMVGRDSEDHSLVFGNAIKALIDFDKAVNGNPDDIEIRLLRANHSCRLPEEFFRRSATAMGDFEYLLQRYQKDNSIFDDQTYRRILESLGEVYERLEMKEEAKSVWDKLFAITDDQSYLSKQCPDETDFDPEKAKAMNRKEALQEGIRLHNLGVAGNKKAAKIAKALLEGVYKANPRNSLAKGYYGSSLALTGRYSANPGEMFSNGIKGFKLVKEAAERDPKNPQLRILRGYLAYHLPESFFHMTPMAITDFRFLIQAYDKDNTIFPQEFYWQVQYDLGMAHRRIGENVKAQKVWSALAKKSKDPKYIALINAAKKRGEP